MRNRLERGRLHKAQRGELFHRVPTGYIKLSSDRVEMDPDEQVREVIRLIFDKYDETRHRLGRLPLPDPQQHPARVSSVPRAQSRQPGVAAPGPADRLPDPATPDLRRGLRLWPPPAQAHPDGHGGAHRRRQLGPDGAVEGPEARLPAGLHHLGPLPGESRIACVSTDQVRAPRGAPATAPRCSAGIVVCGNCGRCLQTSYRTQGRAYYSCVRHLHEGTEQVCFGLKAAAVDDLVAQQVLRALEPAALELSCRAMEDVQRDRARLDKHWKQRLERARYEAEDAERRYRAVDPENRLVARSLEQRWEETLRAERQVRDDYDRFLREQPPQLSHGGAGSDRGPLLRPSRALACPGHDPPGSQGDHPAPGGKGRRPREERQRICGRHDSLARRLHQPARGRATGPVRTSSSATSTSSWTGSRPCAARDAPRRRSPTALNREGFSPPKRCGVFYPEFVHELLTRRGLANEKTYDDQLGPYEWWLPKLADAIPMSAGKLADWARRGWLHSRKTPAQRLWVLWADEPEVKRLRKLAALSHRGVVEYPSELTTPKERR